MNVSYQMMPVPTGSEISRPPSFISRNSFEGRVGEYSRISYRPQPANNPEVNVVFLKPALKRTASHSPAKSATIK